jgi:hypothetical protein
MGRKPKVVISENENSEQLNNAENSMNAEESMVEILTRQLLEMQKQLELLKTNQNNQAIQKESVPEIEEPKKTVKIDGREYINIMSLSNIPLNLTTEPMGRGRLFQFTKFGDVKRIMYDDLIKVVYNHPTFTQMGRFLIMNADVVNELGYKEDYAKILTKEKIELILENKQGAIDLYKSANEVQKKIVHEFLIRKVRDDMSSVDMGLIMSIKRISNIDIMVEAENIKKSVLEQPN